MNLPELVAPAGSFETAEIAFAQGADAVYAGLGMYSLRAHCPHFAPDELAALVRIAHERGKRVYVAFNAMPADPMLDEMESQLVKLSRARPVPDALIVSDPGVIALCRKRVPGIALHVSTQTGVFNRESLRFWKNQGVARVVLPRELSLEKIGALNAQGIVETELFIHGAMCVSIAGRCLLGAYLNQRHANAGDCPQPCRLAYRITPVSGAGSDLKGGPFIVEESAQGAYLLNSKDLNALPILPAVIAAGASALKIEGRNKSVHYISSVVKVYREALDVYARDPAKFTVSAWWTRELETVDHRPYTTGFYAGEMIMQDIAGSHAHGDKRVLGIVKGVGASGDLFIDVKNPFDLHENLDILPCGRGREPFTAVCEAMRDIDGKPLARALTNRVVVARCMPALAFGDLLRRTA